MNDALESDVDLMEQLQCNDEKALALLMKKYYENLYNYGSRFTQDDALIKDCIQEVFISLWQRRETATTILSPRYYLIRSIKNKILKSLHASNRKLTSRLQDEYVFSQDFFIEQVIIDQQISEDKAQKLKQVLLSLSNRQKEIVYLKYYQYLDHAQIAELMNISKQSVYNLLHETIHKLKCLWHAEPVAK